MVPQQRVDEGKTHAKAVGNAALRAELPLPEAEDFLTSIGRIGSHTSYAKTI
jgi:hypothetical protein